MIRIGVAHSLSGPMAMSERPLVDAVRLAIEQLNAQGGLLGESIEMIVADGASCPETFAVQARRLIEEDGLRTLFGCWTSASRKAVKPVVEEAGALLWYPVQYEGLEQSPNIFYFGTTLNQQIEPATEWCLHRLGKRFYLLGSDYVFPRTANRLVRALVELHGGEIIGESYASLSEEDFSGAIEAIRAARPAVIFNTLNGNGNIAFYRQLSEADLGLPVMAVSVAEEEAAAIGTAIAGHYACWGYFQSLEGPANRDFVAAFRARFGEQRVTSDPIASAYSQVFLWADAVRAARSTEPAAVRQAAVGRKLLGPMGEITLLPNHHVTKPAFIGQADAHGQFAIVHRSAGLIEPLPWLGVETVALPAADLIKEALSALPAEIEFSTRLQQEISQRKQAEAALQQLNANLEQRVKAEVEKNLDQERLMIHQSRMAAMGEMIHYIAHQWKQPLNALSILINDIKDAFDYGELDASYMAQSVAQSQHVIANMSETMEDFRNFYRPNKEKSSFNLREILREVNAIIGGSLNNHGVRLEEDIQDDVILTGLPNEYAQVVLNLITNAKEAIRDNNIPDGWIRVSVYAENGEGVLKISDNGGGITQAMLPKIFDPYVTSKDKGSGVGLYMSKIIIEKNMGGRIDARNINGGAEFTVRCPLGA